jgi:hypothetical protein
LGRCKTLTAIDIIVLLLCSSIRRHCLWILRNSAALLSSKTIWQEIVADAKERGCFYGCNDDEDLAAAIRDAVVDPLDQ